MNKVVYGWFEGDQCFYVGLGSNRRPYSKRMRNKHCLNKRAKAERKGTFRIEIFATGLSHQEACTMECDLIQQLGRIDQGTGSLTNMTNGGEGVSGHSPETIQKIKESKKGVKQSESHKKNAADAQRGDKSCWFGKKGEESPAFGYRHTEESRKKISESKKGRKGKRASRSKTVHTPEGVFDSLERASQHYNVYAMTITRWTRDPRKPDFYLIS